MDAQFPPDGHFAAVRGGQWVQCTYSELGALMENWVEYLFSDIQGRSFVKQDS